jgi:plastocyanin
MRKLVLLLTLATALAAPQSSLAATAVAVTKTGFHPAAVTVPAGDTVTWTNNDTARHQIVADNGSFSSPVLAANQSYSHLFRAGGTFAYHDGLHPALTATIAVVPPRTVWVTRGGFVPATISVKAGQSIRWVNRTAANHQIVADDSSFSSPVLARNNAYSHVFANAGAFRYHDGLQPSVAGTVVVAPTATQSITLSSNTRVVTYAGSVTLSGKVVNGTSGEKVTLTADPQAGKATRSVQTLSTATDGTFQVAVKPSVQTVYSVATSNANSGPLVINVRPRMRLGTLSHRRGIVRVTASRSFVHRTAFLQRWNTRRHLWLNIRRVRLTRAAFSTSSTVVTSAVFSLRYRHGTRLRVFFPRSQAVPGYTSNVSNAVRT